MQQTESKLFAYLQSHQEDMIDDLIALVKAQSPSTDKKSCDECADVITSLFQKRLPVSVRRFHETDVGDQLLLQVEPEPTDIKPILVLCHYDTVWNLDELPLHREKDRLYGPGVFDMKSGLVLTLWALRALLETGHSIPGPVWVFCNSDEETGSAASKDRILQLSQEARAVLVAEPAEAVTGSLKATRKGNGHYHVHIKGKAAHAGNDPLGGISAVEEMAHQILHLHALADLPNGTSVNVGVARGGTRANIIADEADMDVDVRFLTEKEAVRIEQAFQSLAPVHPGITLTVTGGRSMPPMEDTSKNRSLLDVARQTALALDYPLQTCSAGGCSDGNLTSAAGIPTLDGLGATGEGLHARHEQLYVDEYPLRTALMASLLMRLRDFGC